MQAQSSQSAKKHPKNEQALQVDRRFSAGRQASDLVKRLLLAHDRT